MYGPLGSYHFHKVTMPDGRMYGSPTLVGLMALLHKRVGVKVNRTAILRAMHPRKRKRAGCYRDMIFQKVGLADLARYPTMMFETKHELS